MTVWIVLGVLIFMVSVFLVVTSILDRKKNKKLKLEKETLQKEILLSGSKIAKQVLEVWQNNDLKLKKFVPSVGKMKMVDINNDAKNALLRIQSSRNYSLIKGNEEEFEIFSTQFKELLSEKSNNWQKRNIKNLQYFKNYQPISKDKEALEKKSKSKLSKKRKKGK